jgi:hypothetical protein
MEERVEQEATGSRSLELLSECVPAHGRESCQRVCLRTEESVCLRTAVNA